MHVEFWTRIEGCWEKKNISSKSLEIQILTILDQRPPVYVKTLMWLLKNTECNMPAHEGHNQPSK